MFLGLTQSCCPSRIVTESVTTQSPWRPNLAETRRRQGAPCHRGEEKQQQGRIPMLLEVMLRRHATNHRDTD
ncbi:hypothetical protein PBY51_003982 [Eleginops maclovinus]|uniref:Uncharacterized protein n=1 Tax=Eleginops maclovinus TaxID=56733 RepID=A0AAN7XVY8_ELEMC|nr:hypothetical protein PBY51_003982 [Eleginops maclovinus]